MFPSASFRRSSCRGAVRADVPAAPSRIRFVPVSRLKPDQNGGRVTSCSVKLAFELLDPVGKIDRRVRSAGFVSTPMRRSGCRAPALRSRRLLLRHDTWKLRDLPHAPELRAGPSESRLLRPGEFGARVPSDFRDSCRKRIPSSSTSLSRTILTDGLPLIPTVASDIAFGSGRTRDR